MEATRGAILDMTSGRAVVRPARRRRFGAGGGFAALLALMVLLTGLGVLYMDTTETRLEKLVNEHMAKIELATHMHHAARERTIHLQKMILLTDPFERDEQWVQFNNRAGDFINARERLRAMALGDAERALLDEQGQLTRTAVPIQERVAEFVSQGQTREAHRLLVEQAIPAQDAVLEQLARLYDLQKHAADLAVEQARRAYEQARGLLLVLSLLIVGLGLAIAVTVLRRVRRADAALHQEKERALATLHSMGDGVISTDGTGRVEFLNPVAERLTGWTTDDALGRRVSEIFTIVHDSTREAVPNPVTRALAGREVVTADTDTVLASRGGEHAIEFSATPLRGPVGEILGAVLVFRDVTEVRALGREIAHQATHDTLTGLFNRREFEKRLQAAIGRSRSDGAQHALCHLDLDLFKMVNDSCGHAAGDELLRQLALIISAKVREGDSLFRLGGDEFAILLNGCPISRAEGIANEIRLVVEDFRFMWEEKPFSIGASIGLVPITADSVSVASLLAAADAACYTAKEKGRNRVQVYEPSDTELVMREGEMAWLPRINRAIDEDRLQLYYQKIANVRDGDVMGGTQYELLLRMTDEHGAIVPPQAFIPAAERYNLMPNVDRWVIRHALDWITRHAAQVRDVSTIYINLSGQSLNDDKFLDFVTGQIRRLDGLGIKIGFEITETAAIANLSRAMRLMGALKEMGCVFALDDFGSGMSSFAYLKNLPVDKIKIDGVFVRDMLFDRVDYAMVEAINRIGHLMGIQTVAEFVENDAILQKLKELGVDYAQGYGIHRPEPLALLFAEPRSIHTTAIAR